MADSLFCGGSEFVPYGARAEGGVRKGNISGASIPISVSVPMAIRLVMAKRWDR